MKSFEDLCMGELVLEDRYRLASNPDKLFHLHPHYELVVCTEAANVDLLVCGDSVRFEHAVAFLVSPFIPHFVSTTPGESDRYDRAVFYFDDSVLNACHLSVPIKDLIGGTARVFDLSMYAAGTRTLIDQFRYAIDPWERKTLFSVLLNRFWVNRAHSTVLTGSPDAYILDVIAYIQSHLEEKLTADVIAERFYVSRDKLKKDFKRCTYTNLGDFIQRMRLNHAKELLEQKVSVNEVIRRCGYDGRSYFFKLFKSETKTTPLEFQKRF